MSEPTKTAVTFLDGTGDTTIEWDDEVDEEMRAWVEQKRREGYTFLVVQKYLGGAVSFTRKLKSVDQIDGRSVVAKDDRVADMFREGKVSLGSVPADTGKHGSTAEVARDYDQMRGRRSVAVPQYRGG